MSEALKSTMNLSSAAVLAVFAIYNRDSNLGKTIKRKFPKIGDKYIKWSPTLEHFAFGYACTAGGFGLDPSLCPPITGGFAIVMDFGWETYQNIQRKKFQAEQFLGTCMGVAISYALNNTDKIYSFIDSIIK